MTTQTTSRRGRTLKLLRVLLLAVCGLLVLLDFVVDRHPHFPIEKIPGFFAICGFFAFLGVVFGGALLGKLVRRSDDYYDREPGDDRA